MCSAVEEGLEPSVPSRGPILGIGAVDLSATPPGALRVCCRMAEEPHRVSGFRVAQRGPIGDGPCRLFGTPPGQQTPRTEAAPWRRVAAGLGIAMQLEGCVLEHGVPFLRVAVSRSIGATKKAPTTKLVGTPTAFVARPARSRKTPWVPSAQLRHRAV